MSAASSCGFAFSSRDLREECMECIDEQVFHAAASAQCPAHGDRLAVRARAETLLRQMTDALLGA